MKKKILGLAALAVAVVCSFAFNTPASVKDVSCGSGKVWFIYNGATNVVEDSNQPAQITAGQTPANYTKLTSLSQCQGIVRLCAICAAPNTSNPSLPVFTTTENTQVSRYVTPAQAHDPALIIEKP
jgi:hypothetical protein